MKKIIILAAALVLCMNLSVVPASAQSADEIVQKAVEYMRGQSSIATAKMTIHRPDWERHLTYKTWTKSSYETVLHIIEPKEEYGNGILKKKDRMWQYNPKVNRIIKVPPSMMSHSWMGSDFSNDDLSKDEDIFDHFDKAVVDTKTVDGKKVCVIECLPKKNAPTVWGMVMVHVREDNIIMKESFYDEDHKLVKELISSDIQMMGGKLFPKKATMQQVTPGHYTVSELDAIEFDKPLEDRLFTLSNLQNPRE